MFFVGRVSDVARRLCEATKACLNAAIAQCGPGVPISRIGQVRGACHQPWPAAGVWVQFRACSVAAAWQQTAWQQMCSVVDKNCKTM